MIRLSCLQAASVKNAVGILFISVEASFVFCLIDIGDQVVFDPVGLSFDKADTCCSIEPYLPYTAVFCLGRCLFDLQEGVSSDLFQLDNISFIVLFIYRFKSIVGNVNREFPESCRDQTIDVSAGPQRIIQSEISWQHALVFIFDLFHFYVSEDHLAPIRRFT